MSVLSANKKSTAEPKVTDVCRFGEQEPYMNPRQVNYFRNLLLDLDRRLRHEESSLASNLQWDEPVPADPLDRGVQMSDRDFSLTSKIRKRQLLAQIHAALARIESGDYGYCQDSGEPIGLRRLQILPFATLSVESQELLERSRHLKFPVPHNSCINEGASSFDNFGNRPGEMIRDSDC